MLHTNGVLSSVLLSREEIDNESPCIFNVVYGQVLSLSQLENDIFVKAPLLLSDEHKQEPAKDEEPEEARQEDRQQKEVLVNEDRLLVALDFHVHHYVLREEGDHAENVEQVR